MSFHTFCISCISHSPRSVSSGGFTHFLERSTNCRHCVRNFVFVLAAAIHDINFVSRCIFQENTLEGLHQGHLNEETCSCAFQNLLPLYFASVSIQRGL